MMLEMFEPGGVISAITGSNHDDCEESSMAKTPYIKKPTNAWMTRGMSLREKLAFYSGSPTATGCVEWCGSRTGALMGYGNMWWDGKIQPAHRLSWISVNGPIPVGMLVCHHCDNPICINVDHLFLGSHQDNCDDKFSKGREADVRGASNPRSKLSEENVMEILASSESGGSLSQKYGVSTTVVSHIRRKKLWSHVGGEAVRSGLALGVRNPMAKLTMEQVISIRESSETGASLARKFDVSDSTIHRVRHRKLWRA